MRMCRVPPWELRSLSKEKEMCNIFKQHFRNLDSQKRIEIKPEKRQLLAHATVKVEKYTVKRLYVYPNLFSLHLLTQSVGFFSTYKEMAKG